MEDIVEGVLAGRDTADPQAERAGRAAPDRAILDSFDQGASLMSYVGHGGAAVWASENVLNSWDPASLQAQSRQPLMITMDCLNGYFVAPNFDALPEAFLKAEGRGAIASLLAERPEPRRARPPLPPCPHAEIDSGHAPEARRRRPRRPEDLRPTGLFPELLSIYHLLGDPTMKLR